MHELLRRFLADTFILYMKTLNFHWNMEGSSFFMYHKMLEDHYRELSQALDEIAERIRQLGHRAPGTMEELSGLASLKESPHALTQEEMIEALYSDHNHMSKQGSAILSEATHLHDEVTGDLILQRMRVHEKTAWLLRSHLSTHHTRK